MALIVDASVAVKWVVEEDGWREARRLAATEALAAPDLIFIECANVFWAKARRKEIAAAQAQAAINAIEAMPIRSVPIRSHVGQAHRMALELGQTAYDCLYLATALAENTVLITADAAFARAALAHPAYQGAVRLLLAP